jgi:hypothetical protein
MAAPPLKWKEDEGYDLHLLRGGPSSKRLIDSLDLDAGQQSSVTFLYNLLGGSDHHGVELDVSAGVVTALPHPDPSFPRVTNFLLSALFAGPQGTHETAIRIHVHDSDSPDSVKDIWLTPSTLMIHQGADDDECRFTVLARFKDGVVGDITDWSQLSYQSSDPVIVKVLAGGVLKAEAPSGSAAITVSLNLPALGIEKTSAPVKALAGPSWPDVGKSAKVAWVAGKVRPDEANPDSVKSVVENSTNILFVAEGFRQDQRGDFNNLVWKVTEELRTKDYLLPFKLLKDSINYWSVFVPSKEEGVSLLGDYFVFDDGSSLTGTLAPRPRKPLASATEWSREELIYEVGLPVREDLRIQGLPEHVKRWQKLYGDHVTETRARRVYNAWLLLASRSLLNERDSAFGLAAGGRQRASTGDRQSNSLRADFRRTSEASILEFVQNLTFAGYPLGATWRAASAAQAAGQDFGLVAFACYSDWNAGQHRPGRGYSTASFGRKSYASLKPIADRSRGLDIMTAAPEENSRTLFASVIAHECSHAFGLGDEYGDGAGTDPAYGPAVSLLPNLQTKSAITSTTTDPATGTKQTVFDKTQNIKWLWPRVTKAGVLDGIPQRSGTGFRVQLRRGHGRAFGVGDMVWFREWPVAHGASADPFLALPRSMGLVYKVKAHDENGVNVDLEDSSGAVVDVDAEVLGVDTGGPGPARWADIIPKLFSPTGRYALICPRTAAGSALRLVAEPILKHIESAGPLTAEPGFDPALCVRARDPHSVMTPTNLPSLSSAPRTRADIIGIYQGGNNHDCGVFRPAGRCKMRTALEKTMPFCHVCRYLLVDRVDPTRHGELDNLYPEVR